ncbi:RHS repeat-associated core domain-containing protein [Pseudomonas syringae]|uniref:RHS repeat-associated core domain-containing protein n=1 Tax=Pseudomonas syringae TaxID=317 RepID=UPI001F20CAF5|nr:RHS repeat-associated core domain-containing protein [Pseudomonas syringae]MBL3830226.1 RHS repeat-associated core domain-containing protein [Pseudomonas syringae pv. theae]MBL3835441.1 RHS repeat-associated core domain-containing protein [Pseudomonas syringae pv. theae]MBL3870450.1 RHS repeat-associated core domain-containing protein [Pseudomonas syringae pv. theae]GKQ47801.1 RHS repeat-associated core domain-containing protein [Pseudomonas syringae pv. theae]
MDDTPEARRVLCRYRYDAMDRVAVVDIEAHEAVSRFYQKSRLTVEIQGAVRRRVFHGEGCLLAELGMDGSILRVDLLGTDMQSSVLEAVSGQERQSLAYSPYGHREQGGPFSGFNGERADPVTGHYLLGNGYRAFNQVLMRFNSPDSLSPFGRGGLNAYAYCQGDPVNRSDPGGHAGILGLPDLALKGILKNLTSKERVNLFSTSKAMGMRVSEAMDSMPIDVTDPNALFAIDSILKSDMSILPGVLKNDAFKATFERAAANIKQGMDKEINSVGRRAQSILDKVTRVPGASYSQFQNAVDRNRRAHAASIEILENIDGVVAEHSRLDAGLNSLIHREADMGRLVDSIRAELNRR